MEVHETALPGIGVRYDITTARGRRVGSSRSAAAPTRSRSTTSRTPTPAATSSSSPRRRATRSPRCWEPPAWSSASPTCTSRSTAHDGAAVPAPDVGVRRPPAGRRPHPDLTGCSIVAVVRGDEVYASPRPDFVFHARDVVVLVGTPEGCRAAGDILGVHEF